MDNDEYDYKITNKQVIEDIMWWTNEDDEIDNYIQFIEELVNAHKDNECIVDRISIAQIVSSVNSFKNNNKDLKPCIMI